MAFVTPTPVTRSSRPALSRTSSRRSSRPAARRSSRATAPPRMIATEPPATVTELSNKAKELLSYVRGHKSIFRPGVGFKATHLTLFRKNDTGRTFTPLEELATNAYMLPGGSVAAFMVVQEDQLVETAVEAVFASNPTLKRDDVRSEILAFDMRYMLRVISYGAACKSTDFIHRNNLGMMKMLHQEVALPAGADVAGLTAAKEVVISQIDSALVESTAACFDVVIEFMS